MLVANLSFLPVLGFQHFLCYICKEYVEDLAKIPKSFLQVSFLRVSSASRRLGETHLPFMRSVMAWGGECAASPAQTLRPRLSPSHTSPQHIQKGKRLIGSVFLSYSLLPDYKSTNHNNNFVFFIIIILMLPNNLPILKCWLIITKNRNAINIFFL